ncbi:hypothetical protein C7S20_03800 [Christiangramia fulva]|uniref:Phosphatidic acid phosphatase type 2/haloperoxidase domain-containing protein n=1 Tax=Christiangramia fulva TaxID=2126553 RepID=A0A2R3Z2G6_9FLAO|nr:vanadium-dependent haloperoxidase [Christiangramia fulva]AVR44454.1 hypothetical protein C7S20_03800 [Christiangramia fulva]
MKTKPKIPTLFWILLFLISGCQKEELSNDSVLNESLLQVNAEKAALSHTKQYSGEIANSWFSLLSDLCKDTPYFPPQAARLFAYSGMSLYESVVPGMPSYQSMYTYLTGNVIEVGKKKDYYWPASANAAMARLATRLLSDYPQPVNLQAITDLESSFNTEFLASISAEQLANSQQFGREVADAIYEWSTTDGTFLPCDPYVPTGEPGSWVPTPPDYYPAAGVCQGDLRTFVPGIFDYAMPPAPPTYSEDPASDFYKMNEEVYLISQNISSEDVVLSHAWEDIFFTNYNVPSHMIKLTTKIARDEGISLENGALLYAQEGLAMFDAIIVAIGSKYEYSLIRPVTYIEDVLGHVGWVGVYPAPQHPSYPAVAPSAAGSIVEILEQNFGTSYHFVDDIQEDIYGTWTYDSFDDLLKDIGRSRTHSGINYQFSVDAGITLGRKVGEKVSSLPFKK